MAHPVRPDSYVEINNFYTVTIYEKGAEVVRMMHNLVGRDGFARGMKLYFERHDGQAVTCDDFASAIADANPASDLARACCPSSSTGTARPVRPMCTPLASTTRRRAATRSRSRKAAPHAGQPDKAPFVILVELGLLAQDGRALPCNLPVKMPLAHPRARWCWPNRACH